MGALDPAFTDSFAVWTGGSYGDFIRKKVQPHVAKYCSPLPGVDQPVLPLEEKIPKLWFHVVLSNETSSLTLAVRMDNLYLVGFKTTAGVWWEFGKPRDPQLISNSEFLGFGGSYLDLIGKHGKLEAVTLGRGPMSDAVNSLAKHGTTQTQTQAQTQTEVLLEEQLQGDLYAAPKRMLVKLVIMICEGLRFLTVSGTVNKGFDGEEAKITEIEAIHVNKWDRISEAVFTWADDPKAEIPEMEAIRIEDKKTAAGIIALVKKKASKGENKDEL